MVSKKETARGLALTTLLEVFDKGAYSNIALNQALSQSDLSDKDKGLVTELVYGTLSRKITLEWYLAHVIEDRDKLDSWVYYLLLLSLYQLLYLDKIPNHAVVNEAVQLAKRGKGTDKFVNAILRKLLSTDLPDPASIKRKNKRYSVQYSLPVWLVTKIIEEYGEERAQAIFASLLIRNKASVRVADINRLEEIKANLGAKLSQLSPIGLVKEQGHFAGTDYFKQGLLTVQDESSQLVAPTLDLQGEEQVLDACAAPGGKTCHMASYLTSGQVTALDLYDHKLTLIEENAQRLGVADRVRTRKLDATQVAEAFGPDRFDKILVDAPCSGIGLIRRKPDIRYNKDNQDFASLQAIQLQILDSVCQSLKKGGIITYSTCTIIGKENQEVIQAFLETHPDFEQVALTHPCSDIVQEGCILITPELYGTDGFFIGQVRRKS
ncbi:TPA: 16S rRNA (cytosine(967)-C(5))-methyltransferase RsmB [Streptococcus suis]|nr:16S rRNA (cytosine(967)-C(5))-methyltransferase RsmB [Streptococcus suis]